ncbi:TAXI family TRAP transporter solute-binding subunit [Marinobacterium arenosum]|uniref:TAXI family TRAP transporter solute-binding subunit n=1 Tax=Marinobacterium arenosum TaxID=2862496 RepID=UPI001C9750D8|nr:TAXI family TRAP transporter solute-binding subunit [Marinobacterium arenosum]MBY4677306.1 TAXI family TRAP transporter solute-binding subunit [Marinobacterium arenosum]
MTIKTWAQKMTQAAVVVGSLSWGAQAFADNTSYILATATTGGTYYPVGVALSTLTKVKLEPTHKFSLSAISSAGSGENVKLLRENQAQFGILMGLYGSWAWEGTGRLQNAGPQPHLRSVSMLWPNVEHFLVRNEFRKSGTLDDLKGLNEASFSIGKRNSGTEGANRYILGQLGLQPEQSFNVTYLGYGASADALQNNNIQGMNTSAGVPVSAVTRATAAMSDSVSLLEISDQQLAQINQKYPLWSRYEIPANTYPGQKQAVKTAAQPNFLAVRDDVDEEHVYKLTKTIYENLPFLQNIHKATKAMSLQQAIAGLPVPLHPGAARYYREQGIDIPDRLIANY